MGSAENQNAGWDGPEGHLGGESSEKKKRRDKPGPDEKQTPYRLYGKGGGRFSNPTLTAYRIEGWNFGMHYRRKILGG